MVGPLGGGGGVLEGQVVGGEGGARGTRRGVKRGGG